VRFFGLLVSATAVLVWLSGCPFPFQVPTISGAVGVTVNEAGDPVLVIAHCQKHVEKVRLSGQVPGGGPRDWLAVAEWRVDPPIPITDW